MDKIVITKLNPRVSIIIPTHNRSSLLPSAIRSILTQTYTDFEVIIIDDASTDNTKKVIASFLIDERINIIENAQKFGIAKSRNNGISLAKGTYIAMLDSDDVWLDSRKLALQVAHLDHNSDCEVVGTWVIQIDELGNQLKKITHANTDTDIRKSILYRNHIAQSSVLFRKTTVLCVGGYDEALATMEDHDLWLKTGVYGKFTILPIYALGYRIHKGNISRSRKTRVALDELAVTFRHRHVYQGFFIGFIKGMGRLIKSFLL